MPSRSGVEVATGHWAGIKGHFPVCSRDQKGSTLHALALLCNTLAMVCTVCTVKCAVCSVHCVQMCCVHCVHFPVCAVCLAICSSSCIVSGLPGGAVKRRGELASGCQSLSRSHLQVRFSHLQARLRGELQISSSLTIATAAEAQAV